MIFYLLFILLFIGGYKHLNSTYYGKTSLILVFLLFTIIGGLRDNVGSDWQTYYNEYCSIVTQSTFSWSAVAKDRLFYFIEYLISRIVQYPHLFFLILFALSFWLKFFFIKNYVHKNIYLALLIYLSGIFLIFDINGIRQGLAIGIALFSTKFIFEKRLFAFIACVISASFIHSSSIIYLLAYPIYNIRWTLNSRQYIILTFLAILLGVFISKFLPNIIEYINGYQEGISEHYEYYAEGVGGFTNKVEVFGIASIRRYVVWALILFFLKDISTPDVAFYKNCMLVSFFIFFLFSDSMEMSYRISYYYSMFELALIPIMISSINSQRFKLLVFIFFSSFYFYLTFKLVDNPLGNLNIYHNILF